MKQNVCTCAAMRDLTSYQTDIARAVLDDVLQARGGLFTVEMACGAGVRELAAQVALLLMTLHVHDGGRVLQVVPAAEDGGEARLIGYLRESTLHGLWTAKPGVVRLGRAECRYLALEDLASFAGPAALVEIHQAQRLDRETYERVLAPLAIASGATVVLYGTPWNGETLFEELKQRNREAEAAARGAGPRRHFRVTWEEAAAALAGYREHVEVVREWLGETHPEFQTRYELRPVQPAGPLLSREQVGSLMGTYARRHGPAPGTRLRASIVVTRLPETAGGPVLLTAPGASAVAVIAEEAGDERRVVETRWLQAADTPALGRRLAKLLGETWHCERVDGDLSPVRGEQAAQLRRLLEHELPRAAIAWASPEPARDSERLLSLIAAANTGRLTVFAADGSPEYRALRHELEDGVASYWADGLVRVRLPQREEGFLRALTLLAEEVRGMPCERLDALAPALAS